MPPRRSLQLAGLWVLTLLALGSLGAPVVRQDNLRFIGEFEKRTPAPWPRIASWQDAFRTDTFVGLSAVLEESMPLRSWMIYLRIIAERDWFGRSRFGEVDRGRDGWLFTRTAYHLPEETPARVDRTLAAFAAHCDAPSGPADLQWVVPLEKHTLYPEYLNASARWYAEGSAWRHARLRSFLEQRGPAGHCHPLWSVYHAARSRSRTPLVFLTDSHHTPLAALLCARAVVDACRPGLWRDEDIRRLGSREYFGDLSSFIAGQRGSRPEVKEFWEVRRPGVELVAGEWLDSGQRVEGDRPDAFWRYGRDRYGERLDWRQACRLRSRGLGVPLVPGRTLIVHDSALEHSRESLRQFFEDVTFTHYDDLIAADDLDERLDRYDRVVVETGERMAIEKMEALLRPVRTQVLARYDGTRAGLVTGNGAVRLRAEGGDLVADATGPDPSLYLPALPAPGAGTYEFRAELDSPAAGTAQLFFRGLGDRTFTDARSLYRKLVHGRNVVYFPLNAEQAGQPLRFDPGLHAGRYRIRSLQILRWLEAPPPAALISAELPALWVFPGRAGAWPVVSAGTLSAGPNVRLTPAAEGLEILQAVGGAVQLPPLDPAPNAAPVVELEWETDQDTVGGLIDTGEADPALCWRLRPGRNRLRLSPDLALWERPLWVQPGRTPGPYLLRRLSVTGVRPPNGAPLPSDGRESSTVSRRAVLVVAPGSRGTGLRCEGLARGAEEVRVRRGPEGLVAQATGADPQLLFPPLDLPGQGMQLVHIDIEPPGPTYAQLFYVHAGLADFTEAQSQGRLLAAGRQDLWFALPAEILRRPWRFDPGCHPGTYRVRRVEVIPLPDL